MLLSISFSTAMASLLAPSRLVTCALSVSNHSMTGHKLCQSFEINPWLTDGHRGADDEIEHPGKTIMTTPGVTSM